MKTKIEWQVENGQSLTVTHGEYYAELRMIPTCMWFSGPEYTWSVWRDGYELAHGSHVPKHQALQICTAIISACTYEPSKTRIETDEELQQRLAAAHADCKVEGCKYRAWHEALK